MRMNIKRCSEPIRGVLPVLSRLAGSLPRRLPTTTMAPLLLLALLLLLLLWTIPASSSSSSNGCSASCNYSTVRISYPFGLTTERGCGHPEFQIECIHNYPVLNINQQMYRIDGADYEMRRITVYNQAARESKCYLPNATADFAGSPFQVAPPSSNLTFLLDCRSKPAVGFDVSKIDCAQRNSSYLGFGTPNFTKGAADCRAAFQVPTKDVEPGDLADGEVGSKGLTYRAYAMLRRPFYLQWTADPARDRICQACQATGGACGYNVSDPKRRFLCRCGGVPRTGSCRKSSRKRPIVIGALIGGGSALVAVAAVLVGIRMKRRNWLPYRPADAAFGRTEMGNLAVFGYRELQEATNFFDEGRLLGDGGFGAVFLGKLRDGRAVAVKKLHEDNSRRAEQFLNEVRILTTVCHFNLVRLFGCCHEGRRNLLLVYEYVPNGTLAEHLYGERRGKHMGWETRLRICLEAAQALAFLHFWVKPPIFHRDVKSTNILLDENLRVKVADFGLSRLLPLEATHVSTLPQGTPGYLDPDYHQSYKLTDKSDVYSFGVVLAEVISSKRAVDMNREENEISLAHLATSKIQSGALHELVDPHLGFESDPAVKAMITSVAELAFVCLAAEKDDRPCMLEVVSQLLRVQQMGYGCQRCQNPLGSGRENCKLPTGVPPFSPISVQATWPSPSTSRETSACAMDDS